MAIEHRRKCGFRKVGGVYLVSDGPGISCHRLPMNLHVCPVCSNGIKYARGFTWLNPSKFFGTCTDPEHHECHDANCAVCFPPEGLHGLVWIGKKFYTPDEFTREAAMFGISKRIPSVPRNFEIGKTWVFLAHLLAGEEVVEGPEQIQGEMFPVKRVPAIFHVFKPSRIEKIITESESNDKDLIAQLERQGVIPVIVPDDDKDHQGSVHDQNEE